MHIIYHPDPDQGSNQSRSIRSSIIWCVNNACNKNFLLGWGPTRLVSGRLEIRASPDNQGRLISCFILLVHSSGVSAVQDVRYLTDKNANNKSKYHCLLMLHSTAAVPSTGRRASFVLLQYFPWWSWQLSGGYSSLTSHHQTQPPHLLIHSHLTLSSARTVARTMQTLVHMFL